MVLFIVMVRSLRPLPKGYNARASFVGLAHHVSRHQVQGSESGRVFADENQTPPGEESAHYVSWHPKWGKMLGCRDKNSSFSLFLFPFFFLFLGGVGA